MALIDNLTNYYKLDESSGNASDVVGGKVGTNTDVTYGAGKINNGAIFNGSSSKLVTNNQDNGGTAWSFSVWVKLNNYNNHSPFFTNQVGVIFRVNQSSGIILCFANGGAISFSTPGAVGTGAWHHVVWTHDNTDHSKVYIDGSLVKSDANDTTIGTGNGVIGFGVSAEYLDGMVDELGIWSRALTSTEVTTLYNSGNGFQYPFPINYPITATQASFSLAGQILTLISNRSILAGNKIFSLTGENSSFSIGVFSQYIVSAALGLFSFAGQTTRALLNGVAIFYRNKFTNQSTSYSNKLSVQNTNYDDKLGSQETSYSDKFTH